MDRDKIHYSLRQIYLVIGLFVTGVLDKGYSFFASVTFVTCVSRAPNVQVCVSTKLTL